MDLLILSLCLSLMTGIHSYFEVLKCVFGEYSVTVMNTVFKKNVLFNTVSVIPDDSKLLFVQIFFFI